MTNIPNATYASTIQPIEHKLSIPGFDISFNNSASNNQLYNAQHAANIGSQFTICVIVGLVIFLAFCIFRTRIPVLFSPRAKLKRHKPPELPKSLFGWIWPLIKIGDEDMLKKVGLDALLMLKFITMSLKIFVVCTFLGLVVFIPITMTSKLPLEEDLSSLTRVSINVIPEGSPKLIAYLVFAYVFTFVVFYFLNQNFYDYIYLSAKYALMQSTSLVARSVIVTGVPEPLRSDDRLSDYYEKLGIGNVESCYVVRTVPKLDHLTKKRAEALCHLERAYASYWGNPCPLPGYDPDRIVYDMDLYRKVTEMAEEARQKSDMSSSDEEEGRSKTFMIKQRLAHQTFFKDLIETEEKKPKSKRPTVRIGGLFGLFGTKVDAIEYYTKLFEDLDKLVLEARNSDEYESTNVAFVTFEKMSSAVIASQIAIHPRPFVLRTSRAYEPRDILWSAISIRGRERIIREIVIWTITVLICITWSIPVTAISSLLSIDTISKLNPDLGSKLASNDTAKLIVDSFIPPLILNIFTSVLPLFFDAMGYYQGLRSRSAIAESTLSKQYFFLIFFTLIFYSVVGTTAVALIQLLADDPKKLPEILANSLPGLAPFFINYVILQGFLIMPLNLLLIGAIIVRGFNHLFLSKTPRDYAQTNSPGSFNFGIGYPAPLLVFAIVFEYSLICPLILLFGTVYFCITYLVYKYQFLYVYFRPYEAAGKLWIMTIPRIIFTLVLFQLTLLGLFFLKGSYLVGGLMIPLIGLTFLFRYILYRAYHKNALNIPMELLVNNLDEEGRLIEQDSTDQEGDLTDSSQSDDQEEIQERWKTAAMTAIHMKRAKGGTKMISKAVMLDEDDYRATPDRWTDYRQPPMNLNPGMLDTGLKTYGNPLLIGHLPQLWLPIKSSEGQDEGQASLEAHAKKHALLKNKDQGGAFAQQLAHLLRNPKESSLIEHSRLKADGYLEMIKKKPLKKKKAEDEKMEKAEMGGDDPIQPKKTYKVHKTYYHHPERQRPRKRKQETEEVKLNKDMILNLKNLNNKVNQEQSSTTRGEE